MDPLKLTDDFIEVVTDIISNGIRMVQERVHKDETIVYRTTGYRNSCKIYMVSSPNMLSEQQLKNCSVEADYLSAKGDWY